MQQNKSEKKQGGQNGHKGKTLTRKDVEKMLLPGLKDKDMKK